MKKIMKLTALALAVIMLVPLFASCMSAPPKDSMLKKIKLTALLSDREGVDCSSGFAFSGEGLTQGMLKGGLTVTPELDYKLAKTAEGITLTPSKPLEQNTVYTFKLAGEAGSARTWAFQTKRPFEIIKVSPEDGSKGASPYAGIEIVSSHLNAEIAPYVTVTPPVALEREVRGYTTVLYPKIGFKPNTEYTVTVSKKAKSPFGGELGSDLSFSFTTESIDDTEGSNKVRMYNHYNETFLPGEVPVAELYLNGGKYTDDTHSVRAEITVSQITEEQYSRTLEKGIEADDYGKPQINIFANTKTVFKGENEVIMPKNGGAKAIVPICEDLPKGFYAADITIKNSEGDYIGTAQKLLQITDAAFYSQSVNGETLVWLNSSANGKPCAGAELEFKGFNREGEKTAEYTANADSEGKYIFKTGESTRGFIKVKQGGAVVYCDTFSLMSQSEKPLSELYYGALYTDRGIYQPTDKVSVWGTVFPRSSESKQPTQVKLCVMGCNFSSYYPSDAYVVAEPVVPVDKNGVFSCQIPLEKLKDRNFVIKAMPADAEPNLNDVFGGANVYTSKDIYVTQYEKPIYKTRAEAAKLFYLPGEPIKTSLTAEFYDGTPAVGLTFSENLYYSGDSIVRCAEIKEDGVAESSFDISSTGAFNKSMSWQPVRVWVNYSVTGVENNYEQANRTVETTVLPRDIMVNCTYAAADNKGVFTVATNCIDTAKIKTAADIYENNYELLKGKPIDIPLRVKLIKHQLLKVSTGSYYDPVNKLSIPTYSYQEREIAIKSYDISTLNGAAVIDNMPVEAKNGDAWYSVEITCADRAGRPIEETEYVCGLARREGLYKSYAFANVENFKQAEKMINMYGSIYYASSDCRYGEGETVKLDLYENTSPVKNEKGTVLYSLVQDKHLEAKTIKSGAGISFSYKPEYIPNMTVIGAYFDGRHIFEVSPVGVSYNCDEKRLSFTLTPDKPKYAPGETVSLTVKAADAKGAPAEASLALGVVDESVFDLYHTYSPNKTYTDELYKRIYYYGITTYASYVQHDFSLDEGGGKGGGGGPETGGGGEANPRKNFKDTAQFLQVKTDKNGMAQVRFALPDNLTSWRVTAVGITEDKSAGESYINVNATLPLFVSPIFSEEYIWGDEVAFASKAYGKDLKEGSPILFRAKVTDSNGKESMLDVNTTVGNYAMFNFGKLPCGEYKVMFSAAAGGAADAVEHSFTVEKSGLLLPVSKQLDPADLQELKPARYPVTLSFYSTPYKEYIDTVAALSTAQGARADEKIALFAAQTALSKNDPDAPVPEPLDLSEQISRSTGGLRLYSYDYTDVKLTALAVVASPELFDKKQTADYFRMIINERREDRTSLAAAIMGLAALGEPVLTDANAVLENSGINDSLTTIYLGVALAYMGDYEGAEKVYSELIKPCIDENEVQCCYNTAKELSLKKDILSRYGIVPEIATESDDYVNWLNQSVGKGESTPHRTQAFETGKGGMSYETGEKMSVPLTARGRNLQRTAAAMLISMKLGLDDTEKLLHYIRENSSYDVATLLEQTAYINSFVPPAESAGRAEVKAAGGRQTLDLAKTGTAAVTLNQKDFEGAQVTLNGNTEMRAFYTASAAEARAEATPDFKVEKEISWMPVYGEDERVNKSLGGDILVTIKVTMNENAPTGVYNISEWVPSNLRFLSCEYDGIWLENREKQKLNLTLYHSGTAFADAKGSSEPMVRTEYRFSYRAKYVTEGICRIDGTYVTHTDSGITAVAPPIENCRFDNAFSSVRTKSN